MKNEENAKGQKNASFHYCNLKVGSCPNDDNSVQIFVYPCLCSISKILFSESVVPSKLTILLRICVVLFIYFLCVGIPFLKIVLSHAHKWMAYDVIL